MTEDDPGYEIARNSDHTVTDCMMRAMTDFGDLVEKVVVITMDKDGSTVCLYSNAHSDPEMMGMMYSALHNHLQTGFGYDEDDEDDD